MIKRELYLGRIRPFIGQPFVKVITGIRRCGKSTMLRLIQEELLERADADHVLYFNFEQLSLSDLLTSQALNARIEEALVGEGTYYLLLDEVQEVEGWERVVNSLMATRDVDIYLTGSNSRLLSGELATYIAGRYVSFELSTLSFAEHLKFTAQAGQAEADAAERGEAGARESGASRDVEFARYLRRGGFPAVSTSSLTDQQVDDAVSDICASVLLRDTVQRHGIRQPEMLGRVVSYALDNIGNTFSANSVAKFMKSQRRRVDPETVYNYLGALDEAFVVRRVPRLDLRGKELLRTREKYYAGDHSLVAATLGHSQTRVQGVLENIVWAELRRRGYDVFVGKLGEREVDFVGQRRGERVYVQVAYLLGDNPVTREREHAPLLELRDSYPKYVVSLDPLAGGNQDGVRHLRIPDFLLDPSY